MLNREGTGVKGFTLIETLIVVAIIGILSAIAIPQLYSYRLKSFNLTALSDLKNFRVCIESSHSESNLYPVSVAGGETLPGSGSTSTPGLFYSTSSNVFLWYESNANVYLVNSWHQSGSKQFGANQKTPKIYTAPGVVPLHDTLTNHVAANQIWPAPWEEM